MPHKKSAMKRLKQDVVRNKRNKSYRSAMKTQIKRFAKAVTEGSPDTEKMLRETYSTIDSVASKGVIHKNKASRLKSRLTRFMEKHSNN